MRTRTVKTCVQVLAQAISPGCDQAFEWAANYEDLSRAWFECPYPSWIAKVLLWLDYDFFDVANTYLDATPDEWLKMEIESRLIYRVQQTVCDQASAWCREVGVEPAALADAYRKKFKFECVLEKLTDHLS